MNAQDFNKLGEAVYNLKMVIESLHPDAHFEIAVDRVSRRIIENAAFVERQKNPLAVPVDLDGNNRAKTILGIPLTTIQEPSEF